MIDLPVTCSRLWARPLLLLAFGLASVPAGAAHAADLCTEIRRLVSEADANFSDRSAALPVLSGAEDCGVTRSLSGPRSYHCRWAFPLRSAAAHGAFEALERSLRSCVGESAPMAGDQGVNHPDSYDLRRYRSGRAGVYPGGGRSIAALRSATSSPFSDPTGPGSMVLSRIRVSAASSAGVALCSDSAIISA